jgi:hypothetical protein
MNRISYKTRFRFIAYNGPDEIQSHTYEKEFIHDEPIIARELAFKEFFEYLDWLRELGRLKEIEGNFFITRPSNIQDNINYLRSLPNPSIEELDERMSQRLTLEEYIEVIYIEPDHKQEWTIHMVSADSFDPQDLLDGLFNEYNAYKDLGLDTKNYLRRIEYYGTDYIESGGEESAAFNDILETPFIWKSTYNPEELKQVDDIIEQTHFEIIAQGEGNQVEFKPSLQYNFNTGKESQAIRYIIAKSICAFFNTKGGILYIGITNEGGIQGLDYDFSLYPDNQRDHFLQAFDRLIAYFFPLSIAPLLEPRFIKIHDNIIFVVSVLPSLDEPVYLNNPYNQETSLEFYIRLQASSRQITDKDEIIRYLRNRKKMNTPDDQ